MSNIKTGPLRYHVDVNTDKAMQYIDDLVTQGIDVDYKTAEDYAMSLIEYKYNIEICGDYTGP